MLSRAVGCSVAPQLQAGAGQDAHTRPNRTPPRGRGLLASRSKSEMLREVPQSTLPSSMRKRIRTRKLLEATKPQHTYLVRSRLQCKPRKARCRIGLCLVSRKWLAKHRQGPRRRQACPTPRAAVTPWPPRRLPCCPVLAQVSQAAHGRKCDRHGRPAGDAGSLGRDRPQRPAWRRCDCGRGHKHHTPCPQLRVTATCHV